MAGIARLRDWWMNRMFAARGELPRAEPSMSVRASLMCLLAAITCILFSARLDHSLLEPEEARYAEIPRQMLLEGRVLIPVLHGEDYLQKPPLFYWLVMLSYQCFGVHDWAARLVPCLAGIGTVIVTTLWAWRVLGFWTGFVSGFILTLSVRFLYLAGMVSMDGLLCFFVLAGLACGHLTLTEHSSRKFWLFLAAIACGLGILTKGPVALALIAPPLMAMGILDKRAPIPGPRAVCAYVGVVAAVAGPWFLVTTFRDPEATGTFFLLHNLARFVAPFDHEKPAWFYLPSVVLGMLPWTLLVFPMFSCFFRVSAAARRPAALGCFALGCIWCILFFSLSGCKRPGYILPAFPLLALMLGTFVTHGLPWRRWMQSPHAAYRLGHRWARGLTLVALGMGVTLGVAAAVVRLWSWEECAFLIAALSVLAPNGFSASND